MKPRTFVFSLAWMILFVLPASAQDDYLSQMRQKWTNSTNYILEAIELMPEEKFNFRPAPEVHSFREQVQHALQNMCWLSSTYLGGGPFDKELEKEDQSKEELLSLAREAVAFSSQALEQLEEQDLRMQVRFFAGPMRVRQIVNLMHDHLTHHQGQIVIYLRMNSIRPPRYVGW
ncbi:MAG: DinB family protein [Bacteroidota bacterium]